MNRENNKFTVSALHLAMQGALIAMCAAPIVALAADESNGEVSALTQPHNFVELGVSGTSDSSAKFGEYNGLDKSGADLVGNLSVKGGDAYSDGDGTTRWSITGTDLGTTSRTLNGNVSSQGHWGVGINYDELQHNISDTYRTYFLGDIGGNSFTAPPTFGRINGNSAAITLPYAANTGASRNLDATQLGLYHDVKVHTDRKNTSFNAEYSFNPELKVQFDFNHLDQSGAKLITGAALGQTVASIVYRAEAVATFLNPTNYTTDNFNLALNWMGDKGHVTGSYYGSIFRDGYNRVSWDNVQANAAAGACASGGNCAYQTNTLSTAPDNQFHQLNLVGGYTFSSATKLAGGVSYGRNTQDEAMLAGLPEIVTNPGFKGLVVNTHADLKLTHLATSALTLSAGLRYNERDNRSSSNTYRFYAINNLTTVDAATNAPYSNRKTELELAGNYRIDKRQSVGVSYNYENIDRWCNSMANGINNCVVSKGNDENKLGLKYKLKATEDVSFDAGYNYSVRHADLDHNAVTPLSGLDSLTPRDVNAQDYPGFIAYIYAPRREHQFKAGATWQATEKLDLGLNGRYTKDDYFDSTLGVQDSHTTNINLDAAYNYNENSSVSAYASWQDSQRDLRSGASGGVANNVGSTFATLVAPVNIFTNQLEDSSVALGISTKHRGLMGGKLEVNGDLSYSLDKAGYSTQLGYTTSPACSATNQTSCGTLPDIKSKLVTLKLDGKYQVVKNGKIGLAYIYQHRTSDDYYYNALQYGYTPSRVMPTFEQAPSYSVHVLAATYIYSF